MSEAKKKLEELRSNLNGEYISVANQLIEEEIPEIAGRVKVLSTEDIDTKEQKLVEAGLVHQFEKYCGETEFTSFTFRYKLDGTWVARRTTPLLNSKGYMESTNFKDLMLDLLMYIERNREPVTQAYLNRRGKGDCKWDYYLPTEEHPGL